MVDSACGHDQVTWPSRMKATRGSFAEAGDRVGGAGQRLRRAAASSSSPSRSAGGRRSVRSRAALFEQMLPRWRWSIAKAFGRVTETDLMLASPGRVRRSNCSSGSWLRLRRLAAAELPDRHLRLERQRRAVDGVEVGGEVGDRPLVADPLGVDRESAAVGRVDHEVRAVDVDLDRAHPDRDAADDLRDRVRDGRDLGVERVDVQRHPRPPVRSHRGRRAPA